MKATPSPGGRVLRTVASLCFAWLAAIPALAASFSLQPSADAFVTTGPNGNLNIYNYGGAGALSVAAAGHSAGEFQSVLRFNLTGARSFFDSQYGSGQWLVQSIRLQLTAGNPGNSTFNASSPGQFHVSWMQNDLWSEGTGRPSSPTRDGISFGSLPTFISAQDQDLGLFSFAGGTSGASSYALGLSSGLTSEVLAGADADFRLFAADSSVSYLFHSRSYIRDSSSYPVLTISAMAVPEPGCVALAAIGSALFLSIRFFPRGTRVRP